MITYAEHQPTPFDPAGAFLDDDRQSWLVAPVSRTRDSGVLDQSNFETALNVLGGESDSVEVHRFEHWGPGWYEIILVDPDSAAAVKASEVEAALSDYPILDEGDYGDREFAEMEKDWEAYGRNDFCDDLRAELDLSDEFDPGNEELDRLWSDFQGEWESDDSGTYFLADKLIKDIPPVAIFKRFGLDAFEPDDKRLLTDPGILRMLSEALESRGQKRLFAA